MEATIYVNTSTKKATSTLSGSVPPSVPVVLQTHLKLTTYFFATGSAPALLSGASFRIALKDKLTPSGSVLALLSAATATNADNYEFEWTSVDSSALRTLIGDAETCEAILDIEWTIATTIERVQIPVVITNSWLRTADAAPDFIAFAASITSLGYLRLVNSSGTVFHIGLNTGEPPTS